MSVDTATAVVDLPVALLVPGNNDRKTFRQNELEELAASIAQNGLAQPITVRPVRYCPDCGWRTVEGGGRCPECNTTDRLEDRWEIVAGERRFRAISVVLKRETAPCIVRDLDDEAASGIMLCENVSRADLDPIEEAKAYQSRIQTYGWSLDRLAETTGKTVDTIKKRVALLSIPADIQKLVASGQLPLGHAEFVTSLDSWRQRMAIRSFNAVPGMSLVAFRSVCDRLMAEQIAESQTSFDFDAFIQTVTDAAKPSAPWGKSVVLDIPRDGDLPAVEVEKNDLPGIVFERYIRSLQTQGFDREAAAVAAVYEALVHNRKCARSATPLMRSRPVKLALDMN